PCFIKTPDEARACVRYLHEFGVDLIKVDFTITDEELLAATEEAAKYGLLVIGHINNIDTAMGYGVKEIEHLVGVYRAEYIREGKPVPTDLRSGAGLDPTKFGPLIQKMVRGNVKLDIALYNWVRPGLWASVKPEIQRLANDPGTA